jgi:hypothetical protein
MVFVLLTYGGWNEAAYLSAEVRGGKRAIVFVLVVALAIITVAYLAVNLALLHGLGLAGLAASKAPGADVMSRIFGATGSQLIALFVAVAALTSINATMIVGARTNYAMGRDWPALRFMGGWHGTRGTPIAAFVVQGIVALALVGFGAMQHDGFEAMVEFTAPVFWTFLLLVGLAVFVLRAKDPQAERPFRTPALSVHAHCVLHGLRMACVVQHHVRREPRCRACLAAGHGDRRRGLGGHTMACQGTCGRRLIADNPLGTLDAFRHGVEIEHRFTLADCGDFLQCAEPRHLVDVPTRKWKVMRDHARAGFKLAQ